MNIFMAHFVYGFILKHGFNYVRFYGFIIWYISSLCQCFQFCSQKSGGKVYVCATCQSPCCLMSLSKWILSQKSETF
jgi:hypothetical protein